MPVSLSQVVSVVLSLAVVYYVLGLIVSTLTKAVLEALDTRGKSLEEFLKRNLLQGAEKGKSELIAELKQMPQIDSLKPVRYVKKFGVPVGFLIGKTEINNYVERIPPKNLVDALFDLKGIIAGNETKIAELSNILPAQLSNFLTVEIKEAEAMRSKMETWFNGIMDQAAQEYKAKARWWVVLFAFVITFVFGVDSIALVKLYWKNAALSATADAQAALLLKSTNEQNQQNLTPQDLAKKLDEMEAANIGWYKPAPDAPADWSLWKEFLARLPGMLITTLAVSQGSSFWYDLLKQIKGDQIKSETITTPSGDIIEMQKKG